MKNQKEEPDHFSSPERCQDELVLHSASVLLTLFTQVECQVTAWWDGSQHRLNPVRSENGYFVGIQVYEETNEQLGQIMPPIEINEADDSVRKLHIATTVPTTTTLEIKVRTERGAALQVCSWR